MEVKGFMVRETEAAVAFVRDTVAAVAGVRPLWVPKAKIQVVLELDEMSVKIQTAQDGERIGVPVLMQIDDAFAAKVGVA